MRSEPSLRKAACDDPLTAIRVLQNAAIAITSHPQLSDWIRGPLREFIPHEKTITGYGQIGFERLSVDRTYGFNIPDDYLAMGDYTFDLLPSPVIEQWLGERRPQFFDREVSERRRHTKWQQRRESHQVENGAFDAAVQPKTGRVAFMKLLNVERDAATSLHQLTHFVTPLLAGIFKRIESNANAIAQPAQKNDALIAAFSAAELKVLEQLQQNKNNLQIAKTLCRSECTVKNHIAKMLGKSGVKSRHQLAELADQVKPPE